MIILLKDSAISESELHNTDASLEIVQCVINFVGELHKVEPLQDKTSTLYDILQTLGYDIEPTSKNEVTELEF
jgi:hypothetical protein